MNVTTGNNPDVTISSTPVEAGGASDNSAKITSNLGENAIHNARNAVATSYIAPNAISESSLLHGEALDSTQTSKAEITPVVREESFRPQYSAPRENDPVYVEKRSLEAVMNFEDWYAASIGQMRAEMLDHMEHRNA